MSRVDDIHAATVELQEAIQRLGKAMREKGMPGDPAQIELECTRMAQDLTDTTGTPLAWALRATARQVEANRIKIERR
jgi:hypothetical protein